MAFSKKLRILLEMIKFEHTIFALPFAYMGMVLGAQGLPSPAAFIWITCAMIGARTYSMGLNRLLDINIDKKNPRTASRALPRGLVTVGETLALIGGALFLFFLAIFMLPSLCHTLWPFVIIPMTLYSLTKRFTSLCHVILGICLGLAPLGAWIGITNTLPPLGIWALGCAVLCWTAGFDIIYSCQDHSFDAAEGLHSIPVRLGVKNALITTKLLHAATVLLLIVPGITFSLGKIYFCGIVMVALFLWYENSIISHDDLSRVDMSFFTLNGFVSIFAFIFTFISLYFHL